VVVEIMGSAYPPEIPDEPKPLPSSDPQWAYESEVHAEIHEARKEAVKAREEWNARY